MAKSSAERKVDQRAKQASSGMRKLELVLDAQEIEMLDRNWATRRFRHAPYEFGEYIALLSRQDDACLALWSTLRSADDLAILLFLH